MSNDQQLADMPAERRTELARTTTALVADLAAEISALQRELDAYQGLLDRLTDAEDRDMIANLSPEALFADQELLLKVCGRAFNNGLGNDDMETFLSGSFAALTPEFRDLLVIPGPHGPAELRPQLDLGPGQDTADLAQLLRSLFSVLSVRGNPVRVEVGRLGSNGNYQLTYDADSHATLHKRHRPAAAGPVDLMLAHMSTELATLAGDDLNSAGRRRHVSRRPER